MLFEKSHNMKTSGPDIAILLTRPGQRFSGPGVPCRARSGQRNLGQCVAGLCGIIYRRIWPSVTPRARKRR